MVYEYKEEGRADYYRWTMNSGCKRVFSFNLEIFKIVPGKK